jgi:glucose/arabinose dehydrogenase
LDFDHHNINLELVCSGLSFPTSVTFDEDGIPYITESNLFNISNRNGCVVKVQGTTRDDLLTLTDNLRTPVNGIWYHDGFLYVSEGGNPGRIAKMDLDGLRFYTILDNLPGRGNYHTNMAVVNSDEKIYFSQGAMTNSGIVGLDSYNIGWLRSIPDSYDIPGYDIVLNGINIETNDTPGNPNGQVKTGAFVPFGNSTYPNQVIKAHLPCTASIMRCNLDGSNLELIAWGLRNSYGIGFLHDNQLLAIDQGADDRGSRPVGNAPDLLYEIHKGHWYGWPDFIGGDPVTLPRYKPERGEQPRFIIQNHEDLPTPEKPLLKFPPHSAATKFEVLRPSSNPCDAQLIVALFGDEKPMTAPSGSTIGRNIVRVDSYDWTVEPLFLTSLLRPIDIRFNHFDQSLYFLDFGGFEMQDNGMVNAAPCSGRLWKASDKLILKN